MRGALLERSVDQAFQGLPELKDLLDRLDREDRTECPERRVFPARVIQRMSSKK